MGRNEKIALAGVIGYLMATAGVLYWWFISPNPYLVVPAVAIGGGAACYGAVSQWLPSWMRR